MPRFLGRFIVILLSANELRVFFREAWVTLCLNIIQALNNEIDTFRHLYMPEAGRCQRHRVNFLRADFEVRIDVVFYFKASDKRFSCLCLPSKRDILL